MRGVLIVALVSAVAGFAVGRWPFVLVPLVVWPAYIWYRAEFANGLGDGWQFALFALTAISFAGATAGVAVRLVVSTARTRTPPR